MKFIDNIGEEIELSKFPERIVSLVPSITELLFDLGLKDKIVGVTRYCVEPKDFVSNLPKIGGTKKLDIDLIRSLKPDLAIGNKEENTKEDIDILRELVPVWVSIVNKFDEALKMIAEVGEVTGTSFEAQKIINNILRKKSDFVSKVDKSRLRGQKVIYFIWRRPFMVVGSNTFINSMLEICGFNNIGVNLKEEPERYPKVEKDLLCSLNPDFVLLSSEPYPFSVKHLSEFKEIFPKSEILFVRGDYFSWYGSRIIKAFDYFIEIFGF